MKKSALYISILLIVLIGGFVVYQKFFTNSSSGDSPVINNQNDGLTGSQQTTSGSSDQQGQASSGTGSTSEQISLQDGSYTGSVADAFYGSVEVKAVISGGKLTNVELLQYPTAAGHTTQVNSQSLPILKSEAIQAQSAKVDIVSGATQTSEAFMQSLASALTQAGSKNQPNVQVTKPTMGM